MKSRFLWVLVFAAGTLTECAHAQNTRIEAEAKPTAGDMKVWELPDASGGKAVSLARDWQPLFIAAPPEKGDAFTVWVRYKDKPILLKSATKDGQKDLGWQWDSPATLTWKRAGRWKREEIGENLVIIRGGGGGQGPILDCVTFATDDAYDPNAEKTDAPPEKAQNNAANINEGAAVALGMQDAPQGQLFEAENFAAGEVVEVAGASGGKAVKSDRDWQPVVSIPLPAGEAWKVWVRHKGGPFCLKTKTGDRWFWNKSDKFQWAETDVFSRDDLGGKSLVIGRDAGGAKSDTVQIDAVVLAPEQKRDLPANLPDANAKPEKIEASIDWSKTTGTLSPLMWGINEHQVADPKSAADPQFQKLLGALKPPLIRIHHGGLVNDWTNPQTRDWDVAKIKAGFAASSGYNDAKIMLCLDEWPSWLSQNATLEPEKFAEFAALCARLVRIMRDEVKHPISYWEITNERDNNFEKAGKLDDLWRLYNVVAAAMRKEDPKAKLGGPALTWAKASWVEGFLKNCPDVQFLSWHNYGTGDLYESNESIFEKVGSNVGGNAQTALDLVKKYDNGRHLETFLTETNVKYTWEPYERRHQNVVGTIFQASVVKKMAEMGVAGVTLWQQHGQAYGSLIDEENKTYPSYTLYQWGPQFLVGKMAATTTGDPQKLEILAVARDGGKKSVLLLNKANHSLILPVASALLPGKTWAQQINATGIESELATDGEFKIPGYSLTLLRSID